MIMVLHLRHAFPYMTILANNVHSMFAHHYTLPQYPMVHNHLAQHSIHSLLTQLHNAISLTSKSIHYVNMFN